MTSSLKIRALAIVVIILICVYGIIGLPTSKEQLVQNWQNNIHLGLDLKGGSQLVLQVQIQDAFKAEADTVIQRLRDQLGAKGVTFTEMTRNDPSTLQTADTIEIAVKGIPSTRAGDFRTIVNDNFGGVWNVVTINPTDYRLTMKATEALKLRQDTLTQSMNTIEKKVNALGLAESSVQQRGGSATDAELLVQLPGVDDPARIKQILKTAAMLELYEVIGGPYASRDEALTSRGGMLPLNSQVLVSQGRAGAPTEVYLLARTPVVTGRDLKDASASPDQTVGNWQTNFVLSQEAAKRFERYTGANIGKRMAIVLDKNVLSAPTIQSKISDTGRITGAGNREEASDLALNLRAGSLPASVEYLEERTVGPSLGADSIKAGLYAGIAGVIAVVLVMLVYYKKAGVNATLALVLNAIILIAALSYFNAVLTLPGIAGVILTIGMAVDSNVLIFERIREELRAGKAPIPAVDAGFSKAFLTIVDTHVTTVVSCAFLFLFGTGPVKGFAVTLVIGLIANVFTAVFVSKTIFDWELGGQKKDLAVSI
jgi:preprotein translocase subunit SecD